MNLGVLVAVAAVGLDQPADFPRPMPGPGPAWVAPIAVNYNPAGCDCSERPLATISHPLGQPPSQVQGPVIDGMREALADVRQAASTLVLAAGDFRAGVSWFLGLLADFLKWLWENYPAVRAGAVKAGAAVESLTWGTLAKVGGAFLLLSLLSGLIQEAAKRHAFKRAKV